MDLQIVILLETECSFSGTDNVGGDTQTLLDAKKIELYALAGGEDTKTSQFSLAPMH